MGDRSKIEWTDATWNPIRGCSVVSEGCRNCYAMQVAARFTGAGQAYEGLAYRNESGAHWTGKVRLVEERLQDPLRWKRPRRIFVNSMSDLFHESLADTDILAVMNVIRRAHNRGHVFQLLTKRPDRMRSFMSRLQFDSAGEGRMYLEDRGSNRQGNPISFAPVLRDLWLGVSVENQETADERIPILLNTPAAVRWISAEPLLGAIDFSCPQPEGIVISLLRGEDGIWPVLPGLAWVVAGGESGPGARPMHPDWVRSIRDQCLAAGVPFFFKQWGEWDGGGVTHRDCQDPCGSCVMALRDWNGASWRGSRLTGTDWRNGNQTGALQIHRVGKKVAGRLLDYREWNEYPTEARSAAA